MLNNYEKYLQFIHNHNIHEGISCLLECLMVIYEAFGLTCKEGVKKVLAMYN